MNVPAFFIEKQSHFIGFFGYFNTFILLDLAHNVRFTRRKSQLYLRKIYFNKCLWQKLKKAVAFPVGVEAMVGCP